MPYFNHFFSKWKYSQGAIDERNLTCTIMPENCKNENWFMNEFNAQFQEKFGLNKTFLYAFMDSWSQSPLGINDPVQQEYWQQETQKLWEFSTERNETFEFMTIDDVLEENAACKEENERLLDIINEEIAKLQDDVRENKAAIATTNSRVGEAEMRIGENQDAVEDNTAAIATANSRVGEAEMRIGENQAAIATTNSRIGEAEMRIGENQDAIEDNTAAIIRDGEKITDIQSSIVLLSQDVEDQEKMIVANTESIATTNSRVEDQEKIIVENTESIATTNSRVGEAEMRIGENQDAVEDNTAALDLLSNEGTFSTYILKLKDKESRSHNVCPRFKLMQNAKLIKPFF